MRSRSIARSPGWGPGFSRGRRRSSVRCFRYFVSDFSYARRRWPGGCQVSLHRRRAGARGGRRGSANRGTTDAAHVEAASRCGGATDNRRRFARSGRLGCGCSVPQLPRPPVPDAGPNLCPATNEAAARSSGGTHGGGSRGSRIDKSVFRSDLTSGATVPGAPADSTTDGLLVHSDMLMPAVPQGRVRWSRRRWHGACGTGGS